MQYTYMRIGVGESVVFGAASAILLAGCSSHEPSPTTTIIVTDTAPVPDSTSAQPESTSSTSPAPSSATQTGRTALSVTFEGTPQAGTFSSNWQIASGHSRAANMQLACNGDTPSLQMTTFKDGAENYVSPKFSFPEAGGTLCNSKGEIRLYLRNHPTQAAAIILTIMQANRAYDKASEAYSNLTS